MYLEHKKAQEEASMQNLTLKDIQEKCVCKMYRLVLLYFSPISVNTSKRTLMFQADEASRLIGMNNELELGLVQLNESHKYVCSLQVLSMYICLIWQSICDSSKGSNQQAEGSTSEGKAVKVVR